MKNPILKKNLTAFAAAWLAAHTGFAANLLLTNSDLLTPGSGGYWPNGANWVGGVAPGPNDVVVLSNSVPSMASYTGPAGGDYSGVPFSFQYIKGLATDPGWTNSYDGLVPPTSIVDSMTIAGLWVPQTNAYNNWVVGNQFTNGCHNLYITNQLNIVSSTPKDILHIFSNTVAIGTGFDGNGTASSGATVLAYATIRGPGSLNVTNPNGCMWVGQGSQGAGVAAGTHAAILDMSGLNTFNCVLNGLYTACDFNTVNSGTDPTLTGYARPQGAIFFALTNNITLLDTNFPALIVGYENNNNGSSFCISNCLGKLNYLNFDQMLVGGPKMSSSVGGMYFMPVNYYAAPLGANSGVPALTDCYAKFRNIDGVSRQTAWILGDDLFSLGTTTSTYGNVNFARGGVDALVDTIYCGRGATPLTNTVLNSTGTAVGALTFGSGTTNLSVIDVNQLELGDMLNFTAPCQGSVTVYSNGTLNVNNYIRLINTPPGASSSLASRGFLFVYGGLVNVSGNILNNGSPGGGAAWLYVQYGGTLDMQPNLSKPPGNISCSLLQFAKGTIKNFATLSVSNLVVLPPNTNFALLSGQALSPGGLGYSDVLTIGVTNTVPGATTLQLDGTYVTNNGNGLVGLSLNNSALVMDIGTGSDKINVNGNITLAGVNQIYVNPVAGFGPGTYPILTYNTNTAWLDANGSSNFGLTGNVATQLVAGGPVTNSSYVVTFDASNPGVINMIVSIATPTALTWVGDGTANAWDVVGANNWNNGGGASKFYQFDSVTFSDSGSASPSVNLTAAVYPTSVTTTANQNYTITGSGQIAGGASLTKGGNGDLNLLTTNTYIGGTAINAGTLRLGNGVSTSGFPGSGAVNIGASGNLAIDVPLNQIQYLTNALTGAGMMTVEGPGTVFLISTNQTYSGSYKVTNGILSSAYWVSISSNATPTTKLIYATNSGTFDINGLNLANYITISGSGYNGIGALVNNGVAQANATMQVFMAGDAAVGGNFRMDLNGISATPSGLTGNGFNLTKVGSNCVSLYNNSTNVFTNNIGNITVSAGVLRVQNGSLLTTNAAKTITVAGGATLEMNNVWVRAAVTNSAILQNGSCIYGTGGTGTNITSGFTNVQGNIYGGNISLNGSDVFDVSPNSILNISGLISGSGSLVKGIGTHSASATTPVSTGTGTLILAGANTFNGSLVVQTGTVVLTNSGSVALATNIALVGGVLNAAARTDGSLTVAASQTLSGVGMVVGTLVVLTNAIIAPGSPFGTISNVGNAFLAGTANMSINKTNGVLSNSQLGVSGGLQLGGTVNVVFSGSGLTNGDKFQLFSSAVISSNFTTVNLPSGYIWTNNLSVDGSLISGGAVSEPTNLPSLTASSTGGSLTLSWPLAYYSYVLQSQTNTLNVGLSSNWVTVPTVNNTITVPINPANGSVFYRLKH